MSAARNSLAVLGALMAPVARASTSVMNTSMLSTLWIARVSSLDSLPKEAGCDSASAGAGAMVFRALVGVEAADSAAALRWVVWKPGRTGRLGSMKK